MSGRPDPLVAQLASRHGEDLLRFLARRTRALDARDLAQEVYVRLLRLGRSDLIRNPEAYLYRVACNLLHEFEISRRADEEGLKRWSEELATDDLTVGDASREVTGVASQVRAVLNSLPEHYRAVLVLHRQEGMTYEEIGRRLSISPSTVKKYLRIGLRLFRERMEGME